MVETREDKVLGAVEGDVTDLPLGREPKGNALSWGDKYKSRAFNVGTYFGLNYVVNTLVSVAIAYVFELRGAPEIRKLSDWLGNRTAGGIAKHWPQSGKKPVTHVEENVAAAGFEKKVQKRISDSVFMSIEGLLLPMGGNFFVPIIKGLEDHHHRLEFEIGHTLDVLQEKTGHGTVVSKQNITDYHKIKLALYQEIKGELSPDEIEKLEKKHHLQRTDKGTLTFSEHKLPWMKIIAARAAAWAAAIGTNGFLGLLGTKKVLEGVSPGISGGIGSIIPAYGKLAQPDLASKLLANDSILAVSSAFTHKAVQNLLYDPNGREKNAKGENPKLTRRGKILSDGPKDSLRRNASSSADASHAIS